MTTALVLAGHGSHISPHTAGLVWNHVDSLRAMGIADEITAAFWKEPPAFSRVLHTLTADDVTIVPLFTAQGYFTGTVIPAEMGLTGSVTHHDGRTIRYTRTVGEHPYLTQVVRERVISALRESGASPEQVAVAVIGHSTRRNAESRKATERQADLIRNEKLVREVVAVYLDDVPSIPDVYTLTTAPILIAVPYFLAAGSHTTLDVPDDLGISTGETHGRTVIYTAPVGVDDALLTAVLELAREADAPLCTARDGSVWDCFPAKGRDLLIAKVTEAAQRSGTLQFGQLTLSPERVWCGTGKTEITSPDVLRTHVRQTAHGFRPLPTSRDLPDDWHVPIRHPAMLHAVVETVYPGVVADWTHRSPVSWDRVIGRQVGMFRKLHSIDPVAAEVCTNCVLHPAWLNGVESTSGELPCAEACNVLLSRTLELIEGQGS